MKNTITFSVFALMAGVTSLNLFSSCCEEKKIETPQSSIIESTDLIGIWQKEAEVVTEDEEGNEFSLIQTTNLYKCILADGSFFLFRAYTDSLNNNISQVELYGTYTLSADTLCSEFILCHCTNPSLTGIASDLHYNMPEKDVLNVWYNLKNSDGTSGSNEWTPEVWRRVSSKK